MTSTELWQCLGGRKARSYFFENLKFGFRCLSSERLGQDWVSVMTQ